jgi:ankyrin repeat protein
VNKCKNNGASPVIIPAQVGHGECIRRLHEIGSDANKCNNNGASPVIIAAQVGHVECIRLLHELGTDVNKCSNNGNSSLHIAAYCGHAECITLLYKLGADIDTLDNDGTSPLRSAIEEEHIECVRVLVQFGANVNSILVDLDPIADIQLLVSNMQSLLQLIANYMSTRPYDIQQVDIDILLPEYAVVFQRNLSIARFETLSLLKLR